MSPLLLSVAPSFHCPAGRVISRHLAYCSFMNIHDTFRAESWNFLVAAGGGRCGLCLNPTSDGGVTTLHHPAAMPPRTHNYFMSAPSHPPYPPTTTHNWECRVPGGGQSLKCKEGVQLCGRVVGGGGQGAERRRREAGVCRVNEADEAAQHGRGGYLRSPAVIEVSPWNHLIRCWALRFAYLFLTVVVSLFCDREN